MRRNLTPLAVVLVGLFLISCGGIEPVDESTERSPQASFCPEDALAAESLSTEGLLSSPPPLKLGYQCNNMAAEVPIPAAVARPHVPLKYDLFLGEDGLARLHFVGEDCYEITQDGQVIASAKHVNAYIQIVGPFEIIPIPGTYFTFPTYYFYNVNYHHKNTEPWITNYHKALGFPVTKVKSVNVGVMGPMRTGSVVETICPTLIGYNWTEYTAPPPPEFPPGPYGMNIRLTYDNPVNGKKARGLISGVGNLTNVGMVFIQAHPASQIGKRFGTFLQGQTLDLNPASVTVTLWSE